jgi:hypothetical protein
VDTVIAVPVLPASTAAASTAKERVALVIPAWNEAGSIGAVLAEVPPGVADCVFVVAGESTDGTAEIARAHGALVLGQDRPGYGAACWAGARAAAAAGARIVVFLDGDYSDPPAELHRILAPLLEGRADLVFGRREAPGGRHPLPLHARLGNSLVLALLGLLVGRRLRDLPSFKAMWVEQLMTLGMSEMTYGWTTELVVKSIRAGWRIEEVPVPYRSRLAGHSKVSGTVRGSLGAAWKLLSCALRYAHWSPGPPPGPARGAARRRAGADTSAAGTTMHEVSL